MDEFRFSKTRIAPTPSGFLHRGNGFSFILTAALAKLAGSRLALRIDDLDRERFRPEYLEDIFKQLEWLGIEPDEGPSTPTDFERHHSQHQRLPRYMEIIEQLDNSGLLYACTCSRKVFLERKGPYCSCASLSIPRSGDHSIRIQELPNEHVLKDVDGHATRIDLSVNPGSVPLLQKNGLPAYHVASIADDLAMGTDLIVRGADLLPSSAMQRHIATAVGAAEYLDIAHFHHGLILDAGEKMSKSAGSTSLRHYQEQGGGVGSFYAWIVNALGLQNRPKSWPKIGFDCMVQFVDTVDWATLVSAGRTSFLETKAP